MGQNFFFRLLQNELWRKGDIPDALTFEEFAAVHVMAREQTVAGLVCNAIVRNNVRTGDDNAMRAMAVRLNHERRAMKMAEVLRVLTACLDKHRVNYVVFKGQILAELYPEPVMRTLGDIDFYCAPADEERARRAVEQEMGVTVDVVELDKHHSFYYDGIRIELHYRMETFGSSRHQRYFDALVERTMREPSSMQIGTLSVKTMPPMMTILVCFKHLFNHFLVEGVGLRQICDMAMLFSRYHDEIDADELWHHISMLGYAKAFKAVGALTVKYVGLPAEAFPFALTKRDYRWADRMMKEVLKRGNFGKYHRRETQEGTAKSLETARIAFGHCARFLPLAPWDILCLMPRRTSVTMKKYLS